jgi:hypothetical protein
MSSTLAVVSIEAHDVRSAAKQSDGDLSPMSTETGILVILF